MMKASAQPHFSYTYVEIAVINDQITCLGCGPDFLSMQTVGCKSICMGAFVGWTTVQPESCRYWYYREQNLSLNGSSFTIGIVLHTWIFEQVPLLVRSQLTSHILHVPSWWKHRHFSYTYVEIAVINDQITCLGCGPDFLSMQTVGCKSICMGAFVGWTTVQPKSCRYWYYHFWMRTTIFSMEAHWSLTKQARGVARGGQRGHLPPPPPFFHVGLRPSLYKTLVWLSDYKPMTSYFVCSTLLST